MNSYNPYNPAQNPAFQNSAYSQQTPMNAQNAQNAQQPQQPPYVQQPPMYAAPMRPRVQVHFKNKYEYITTPNIFVAFLAILGIVLTVFAALQMFIFPDTLLPVFNLNISLSTLASIAFLVLTGIGFIAAGISVALRKSQKDDTENRDWGSSSSAKVETGENDATTEFSQTTQEADTVTLDEFSVSEK
ncbi:hypothetical protein [Alloscardovia omnicolens]|uniref:hypothetical protein n=1 Tax=Alloscardovia omnicolens TaxID=419015 RepID=UPI000668C255|nr:hypothetical protein [Alloscardovia omnicolens]